MEELRRQLENLGVNPDDVDGYIEKPWTAPAEVQTLIQAWMNNQGQATIGEMPEDEDVSGASRFLDVQDFDIAQKISRNEELTPEEQERVGGLPSDAAQAISQLAAQLAGDQQINYDWVYNSMQLTPGSLDSTEAILSLMPHLEEIVGLEFDRSKTDEELATDVKTILARSPSNLLVQTAIADWGRANEFYLSPSEQTFSSLVAKGVSAHRAKTFQLVGQQLDIDPEMLADIWESRKETMETAAAVGGPQMASQFGIFQTAEKFREGLELYEESNVLAAIHVSDPNLAAQLRNDPYSLDSGELKRALEMIGQAPGQATESDTSDPQVRWLRERLAGGFQATATVDSGAIKEAVDTLAKAWNLTGVEGVAAGVAQNVIAGEVARARAQLPNPFGPLKHGVNVVDATSNIEANIRQRLRQSPEYQELIGANLAPGESEEEYVGRFERRSQSQLGDDVAGAVRNAMRTGNINTIYQQGLQTDVGESSTRFQEILARNAQVFRDLL